jgi:hypothetical protein
MWRAFFLAIGSTLVVMGLESLVLDHAVLDPQFVGNTVVSTEPVLDEWGFEVGTKQISERTPKTISPPEWAPWSLLSSGTIILLYSLMPRGS